MNHITNMQYIPHAWKKGIITPIPKPGKDSTIVNNWRPITQVPAISKCYEKHIDKQIRQHCVTNNLFDPDQFGFRENRSTVKAAAVVMNQIIEGLNNMTPTFAVLLDLQAAFDVIWHKGIIYKMHQMNFDPCIIRLASNYLRERKIAVRFGECQSNHKSIIAGCPQGTILAATFFLIYINDFPKINNIMMKIRRILYADDVTIICTTRNIKYA